MDTMTTQPDSPSTTNNRNKGGRPRLLPEERRRHIFQPGFNDHEARQLIARAEQAGLDTVELIRRTALNSQINTIPTCNREAMVELTRIGNNLNQVARALNSGQRLKDGQVDAWLDHVKNEIAAIGRRLTGTE